MLAFPKESKTIRKNTNRHLTTAIVEKVLERDQSCIICGSPYSLECHHVYFGYEANRGLTRNNPDQLVMLCQGCHYDIHSHGDRVKREKCKLYLNSLYAKTNVNDR